MAVEVKKQVDNILVYKLYEEETGGYIKYYLNLDEYELVISGEVSASYRWPVSKRESFIDLMLRCNYDYLINKLGSRFLEEFDLKKSIEKTIDHFNRSSIKEDLDYNYDEFIDIINHIDASCDYEFVQYVSDTLESYDFDSYDWLECIECVVDYTHWLKRTVELFCSEIKPLLRGNK